MASSKSFTAMIKSTDSGGAFVEIPFDVESTFGSKRPKVKATFDGEPYRGTAVRMGGDCHILIIRKDIRATIDKQPGDKVRVAVELDTAPRVINVPTDFRTALNRSKKIAAYFDGLSYTHRKEYVQWITEAKRDDTRQRRIAKAIDLLKDGTRTPR